MTPSPSTSLAIRWPLICLALTLAYTALLLTKGKPGIQGDSGSLLLDTLPTLFWLGLVMLVSYFNDKTITPWLGSGFTLLFFSGIIRLGDHFIVQPFDYIHWLYQIAMTTGSVLVFMGLLRLLRQFTEQSRLLGSLASGTPLASLANSRNFYQYRPASGRERKATLLLIAIDDFNQIARNQGKACCDYQLVKLAELIGSVIRKHDRVVRWGGEEFVLELGGADMNTARVKAEHLRMMIADHPFSFAAQSLRVTVSIGVAEYDGLLANRKTAIIAAKTAMTKAAAMGGNKVLVNECQLDTRQQTEVNAANDSLDIPEGKPH